MESKENKAIQSMNIQSIQQQSIPPPTMYNNPSNDSKESLCQKYILTEIALRLSLTSLGLCVYAQYSPKMQKDVSINKH